MTGDFDVRLKTTSEVWEKV